MKKECCVQCSLPCVGMADCGSDIVSSAKEALLLPFETIFAKEAKNKPGCLGKPLDCSIWRCFRDCSAELSGDSVLIWETFQNKLLRETADSATKQ